MKGKGPRVCILFHVTDQAGFIYILLKGFRVALLRYNNNSVAVSYIRAPNQSNNNTCLTTSPPCMRVYNNIMTVPRWREMTYYANTRAGRNNPANSQCFPSFSRVSRTVTQVKFIRRLVAHNRVYRNFSPHAIGRRPSRC